MIDLDRHRFMTTYNSPPTFAHTSARIAWVDYAKGLAIILVVYGHSARGLIAAGLIETSSILSTLDYIIYSFHMPLFFFLSGIFGSKSYAFWDRRFWFGRLPVIVWPYLVWMTIELALLATFAGRTNSGPIDVSAATYFYAPIAPFWFLYALAFSSLFVHGLIRHGPTMLALSVPLFALGQLVSEGIVPLVTWGLLYFCLGAACANLARHPDFDRLIAAPSTLMIAASGSLTLCLMFFSLGIPTAVVVPAAVMGGLAVLCLARQMQERPASGMIGVIGYLGRISLTILVVHILGTASTRIILSALGVQSVGLHLIAGTMMGLAAPVAVQIVCTRLRIERALGLPRLEPQPKTSSRQPALQL